MATITVNYTPETTGPHRIAYKLEAGSPSPADPNFCRIVDLSASTPGNPKIFIIDAGVTPCDAGGPATVPGAGGPGTYTYDGYVQPTCAPDDGATLKTDWDAPVDIIIP